MPQSSEYAEITRIIVHYFPTAQAIYLYGSYGTDDEWPDSDVDIAILLPHVVAKQCEQLPMTDTRFALEALVSRSVDLINLRLVSTVFQKEVVMSDRRIYCADAYAADEFEMLTLSYYQELNYNRREILAEFRRTGRAYPV